MALQRNLRVTLINGQGIEIKDVTDHKFDDKGLHVTRRDVTEKRVGDKVETTEQLIYTWFNSMSIMTYTEQYVKA